MQLKSISLPKAKTEQLFLDSQQMNIILKYVFFQTKDWLRLELV